MTKEDIVKEIAWLAWKSAAWSYRMTPDAKHTFTDYWGSAKDQYDQFIIELDKLKAAEVDI
jgi:hypothetical protein